MTYACLLAPTTCLIIVLREVERYNRQYLWRWIKAILPVTQQLYPDLLTLICLLAPHLHHMPDHRPELGMCKGTTDSTCGGGLKQLLIPVALH
jgi:hypothetical protein